MMIIPLKLSVIHVSCKVNKVHFLSFAMYDPWNGYANIVKKKHYHDDKACSELHILTIDSISLYSFKYVSIYHIFF